MLFIILQQSILVIFDEVNGMFYAIHFYVYSYVPNYGMKKEHGNMNISNKSGTTTIYLLMQWVCYMYVKLEKQT